MARARRDSAQIGRTLANVLLWQTAVQSLLVDEGGHVQGYCIVTDNRADSFMRIDADGLAIFFMGLFGDDDWACADLPRLDGENNIGGRYLKQSCVKETAGRRAIVETRYYYRPGQAGLDRFNGLPTPNQFESSSRLEVYALAP